MNDESLSINTVALQNCFLSQKRFPKWRKYHLKNGEPFFVKKLKILCIFYRTILFKFHQHVVQTMYAETLNFQCQLASVMVA